MNAPARVHPISIFRPADPRHLRTGAHTSVQDRDAAAEVVAQACIKVPGLKKLYADGADGAYGGKCAVAIEQAHGISVEVVRHPGNRTTKPLATTSGHKGC